MEQARGKRAAVIQHEAAETLGGPMSANDDLPALRQEMDYLRAAATGSPPTPVLGICLGAQLLSRTLAGDYELMGDRFDPAEEAARNLREFASYAPLYERQMARMLRAFLKAEPGVSGDAPADAPDGLGGETVQDAQEGLHGAM